MLEIRLVCSQCGQVVYVAPAISDALLEDINCEACKANLCCLIRTNENENHE